MRNDPATNNGRWTLGRILVGLGSLVILGFTVIVVIYLAAYSLSRGSINQGDLLFGGLMAIIGVGAVVVLVRLYRGLPMGWLAVLVLALGFGLPALVALPYLIGVPFVLDF
ncbi:MAG TPA: hypothetical protein VJ839_01500 [Candidatus Limnocylindria bacterium]|nr:hypothetical protein [Candidatus Limnocylindria bacterium]